MHAALPALSVLLALVPGAGSTLPAGTFRDHRGLSHQLPERRPVLALVVSASRLKRLKGWEERLRKRCGDVPVLRVADVPRTPPMTLEQVAKPLRGRVPAEVDIIIDLDRRFADTFALDTLEINALVFDAEGTLLARSRGRAEQALGPIAAALQPLGLCKVVAR